MLSLQDTCWHRFKWSTHSLLGIMLLYAVFMLETLKGLWHKDFAALVQFCAGVIMPLLTCIEKCSCRVVRMIMKQISLGSINHNQMFWWFLEAYHQNLKRLAQLFKALIHVHLCHVLQQTTVNSFNAQIWS